jgi:prolyl oligopeptidase
MKTDLSEFETRQLFATSKDGTRIPLFITCRKNLKLDGSNPVLLYAYGGFDVNTTLGFDIPNALWLRHGGICATAIIRGGGEYGESWRQADMLAKKKNSFDEFQAAAQFLIDNRYTTRQRLAAQGASNDGLLTAACMLQRPDLYGAVLSEVPVIDMLRHKKFAADTGWIPEYGDAEASPDMLKPFSPIPRCTT